VEKRISSATGEVEQTPVFFVAKIASDIPAPTPAPTYAPTPEGFSDPKEVASVNDLTRLIKEQGKYDFGEYQMAAGTYTWPVNDAEATAQFDNIHKEVWIKGSTESATDTVFDGFKATRFFRVVDGGKLTISNILFKNGRSSTGGGAIQVDPKGQLMLRSCHFDDNDATGERGGGALQVSNDGDDVGIAEVISCKFHGNKAAAYGGGAIYSSGRVSVIRSTFEGNNAGTYGGDAFFFCGQTQLLDRSHFIQNRDPSQGTGIQNTYFVCKGAKLEFHDTSFKAIGKDGTGDTEDADCARGKILAFDEFDRFGECVNSALAQFTRCNFLVAVAAVCLAISGNFL